MQGISYYRIKQTDFNGSVSYSESRKINFNDEKTNIIIYPNPAKGELNINGIVNAVTIFNYLGKSVLSKQYSVCQSNIKINTSSLGKGIYIVQITDNKNRVTTKKITIQ